MTNTGSDYLNYEKTLKKGFELIDRGGFDSTFGLFVVAGSNLALRVSDLLQLTFEQLSGEQFTLVEKKTGKKRIVQNNRIVREAVKRMPDTVRKELGGKAFVSRKGTIFSSQQLNRLMKKHLHEQDKLVTTHSLRKTFARRYFDLNSEHQGMAIARLQTMLNHSSPAITLRYIGITQEETNSMYHDITQGIEI